MKIIISKKEREILNGTSNGAKSFIEATKSLRYIGINIEMKTKRWYQFWK